MSEKNRKILLRYWIGWITFLIIFVLNRYYFNLYFLEKDFKPLTYLLYAFLAVSNFIECNRLFHYLEKEHYEKWKGITNVPGFGEGGANFLEGIPFLFSDEDFGDPKVLELKKHYKLFLIYTIVVLISYHMWK